MHLLVGGQGSPWKRQTTDTIAKGIGCSPQTDGKVLLLKEDMTVATHWKGRSPVGTEDPGSVPSTYIGSQSLVTSVLGDTLFWPVQAPGMDMMFIHVHRQKHPYTYNKIIKSYKKPKSNET